MLEYQYALTDWTDQKHTKICAVIITEKEKTI